MNKFKMCVKKRLTDELARIKSFSSDFYKGEQEGINFALYAIDSIDEPEKPVLSKAEDEWLTRVKKAYPSQSDRLRIITRQGWGYDFEVTIYNKEYKLSYEPYKLKGEDLEHVKERFINAILYGHEIEKEKLYRMKHKLTGEYLSQNYAKTGYYHSLDHFHILELSKKDWEDLVVWGDSTYEIEEVEE